MKRFAVTPSRFLKRFLPQAKFFHRYESLRFVTRVTDPNVWHLNRRSVSGGLWIGVFLAFQPLPLQMPMVAVLALWARVNLPVSVVSTWITNPITFYPIYYLNFSVGCFILGIDGTWSAESFSWGVIFEKTTHLLFPIIIGSFFTGLLIATLAYSLVRFVWRWYVIHRWEIRMGSRPGAKQKIIKHNNQPNEPLD